MGADAAESYAAAAGEPATFYTLIVRPLERHGHVVAVAFVGFCVAQLLSHLFFTYCTKAYRSKTRAEKISLQIHAVAAIHSWIVCGSAYWFFFPDQALVDNIYAFSPFLVNFFAISTGYFLWDLMVVLTLEFEVAFLVHASLALFCFFSSLYPFLHYYGCYFLGCFEISTPYLHVREIVRKLDREDHWLYNSMGILFAILFTVCRIMLGTFVSYHWQSDMWALYTSGQAHSNFVVLFYMLSNAVLMGLNYFWFTQIVRGAIDLFRGKKESEADKKIQ